MHPAPRLPARQLAVARVGLGQQHRALAQRHQRIDLRVKAFDMAQVGLHHFTARHLAGMNRLGQRLGIQGNDRVDG
ncbi:hypothetical protein D3C80_1885240 [compost metagenome]